MSRPDIASEHPSPTNTDLPDLKPFDTRGAANDLSYLHHTSGIGDVVHALTQPDPQAPISGFYTDGHNEFDIYFHTAEADNFRQQVECGWVYDNNDNLLPPKLFTVRVTDETGSILDLESNSIQIGRAEWEKLRTEGIVITRFRPNNTKLVLAIPSHFHMTDLFFRLRGMEDLGYTR